MHTRTIRKVNKYTLFILDGCLLLDGQVHKLSKNSFEIVNVEFFVGVQLSSNAIELIVDEIARIFVQ